MQIISENDNVKRSDGKRIRIKYRYGGNFAFEWDVFIERRKDTFEIVMENSEEPFTTFGYVGAFGGREFLKEIEYELNHR
jgi:hypothetical protein